MNNFWLWKCCMTSIGVRCKMQGINALWHAFCYAIPVYPLVPLIEARNIMFPRFTYLFRNLLDYQTIFQPNPVLKSYRDVKPNIIIGHGAGGSIFFGSSTFYICISTYNYLVLIYIYSYNPSSTMRYVDIASKDIINSYLNRFQVQLWKLKK